MIAMKFRDAAADAGMQAYEAAALLNLGRDYSDDMEAEPWMLDVLENTGSDGVYRG